MSDKGNLVQKQKVKLSKAIAVFNKHHKKAKMSLEEPSFEKENTYNSKVNGSTTMESPNQKEKRVWANKITNSIEKYL